MIKVKHRASAWAVGVAGAAMALFGSHVPAYANGNSEAMELINESRAAHGLCLLQWDRQLDDKADYQSYVMATQARLHHSQLTSAGGVVSENVGRAHSVAEVHRLFLLSPGHRANLLDSRVDQVGIGAVERSNTHWVTYQFAESTSASSC